MKLQLVTFAALTIIHFSHASRCTFLCDLEGTISPKVHICGTDGLDHDAPLSAIFGLPPPWSCYRQCGVTVRYPGTCDCPNECGRSEKRGECRDKKCQCEPGWGGEDCSLVTCPNECSGHGQCQNLTKTLDWCVCEDGYTGADCSITKVVLPNLPYGQVGNNTYYFDDKYEDNHPIFNLSVIGHWDIEMDELDYNALMEPADTWNGTKAKFKAHFWNGNVEQKITKGSMKLKGHFARVAVKKSYVMSFKDDFFSIENLVLKAPALDPTYFRSQVIVEYFRAMAVPSARASFSTLTINGKFMGLFWMKEEIDDHFINSRTGNNKGNFYVMSSYLGYIGDDAETYKNQTETNNGRILPIYKQDLGKDESWTDLVAYAKFINTSSDEEFASSIEKVLDVDRFIRTMVVTSAVDDPDSYTRNGNNWAIYNNPDVGLWQFVPKDFEDSMLNPFGNATDSVSGNIKALLAHRLFRIEKYLDIFNSYYDIFLEQIMNPSNPNSAVHRIRALVPVLNGIIKNDEFFAINYAVPQNSLTWKALCVELELFIKERYNSLRKQFHVKKSMLP